MPLSIHFQCDDWWMVKTSRDASPRKNWMTHVYHADSPSKIWMQWGGGLWPATIHGHAAALKRSVGNCQLFRKTPTIPPQGPPMPLTDPVGMGLAVELLFHSLNAMPRIKGESPIQFDSMRQPRATFTSAWESSPIGIQEGSTFTRIVIPLAHRQAMHQRQISHSV